MALIINPGGSEIRGSIGSNTHSRNRYGAYVRGRTIPVQPATSAQAAVKYRLSDASAAWRGLTEAQQNGWSAAAESFPAKNKLGQTVTLTGQALFVRLNTVRLAMGNPIATDIPVVADFSGFGFTLAEVDVLVYGTTFTLSFDGTLDAAFALKVEATAFVSPGVKYFGRGAYKIISYLTTAELVGAGPTYAMISDYEAVFGSTAFSSTDLKVGIKISLIKIDTGEIAPWTTFFYRGEKP